MLRYGFQRRTVRPFVEAGYAGRLIHGSIDKAGVALNVPNGGYTSYHTHTDTNYPNSRGFVAGGGVSFNLGRFQLEPEVRYTHWNNAAIRVNYPDGPGFLSTQNQLEILVGVKLKEWGRLF